MQLLGLASALEVSCFFAQQFSIAQKLTLSGCSMESSMNSNHHSLEQEITDSLKIYCCLH